VREDRRRHQDRRQHEQDAEDHRGDADESPPIDLAAFAILWLT
jgi:hypothetical protein